MKNMLKITVTLCVLVLLIGVLPIHGESEIYSDVVRLHVLANSDSEEDQTLKLQVRDAILEVSAPLFADCRTREDAIEAIHTHHATLEAAAKDAIASAGRSDTVRIELGEEVYPTKSYESFCFPSGSYVSLRVLIGEAEGQNWWCVLFPPMCLGAATEESAEEACIAVGLTGEQYRVITETDRPTYTVRFRMLEVFEEALRRD